MTEPRPEELFNPQKGLSDTVGATNGKAVGGNDDSKKSPVAGDSPTEGTVEGPLAPAPSPGSADGEADVELAPSELRPKEPDHRISDGVAVFKEMEEDSDRRHLRASPYNLR